MVIQRVVALKSERAPTRATPALATEALEEGGTGNQKGQDVLLLLLSLSRSINSRSALRTEPARPISTNRRCWSRAVPLSELILIPGLMWVMAARRRARDLESSRPMAAWIGSPYRCPDSKCRFSWRLIGGSSRLMESGLIAE